VVTRGSEVEAHHISAGDAVKLAVLAGHGRAYSDGHEVGIGPVAELEKDDLAVSRGPARKC